MSKENIKIGRRVARWIISHPWLKLIALILAIMVWFYAGEEISKYY